MSYNIKQTDGASIIIAVIAVIAIVISLGLGLVQCTDSVSNERTIIRTVTDKEVKRQGESNDIYLIYTKDEQGDVEVLIIDDNILLGHFNSSDLYAEVEIDKTYEFVVTGSRNNFLSWYPNIHSLTEATEEGK